MQGWGVGPKTVNFTKFSNINAPQGRIPCTNFTKFSGFVGSSTSGFTFGDLLERFWSYGLGQRSLPNFHPSSETVRPIRKSFRGVKMVRNSSINMSCAAGEGVKKVRCFLSFALLNGRVVLMTFANKVLEYGMNSIPPGTGSSVVVHCRSALSLCC